MKIVVVGGVLGVLSLNLSCSVGKEASPILAFRRFSIERRRTLYHDSPSPSLDFSRRTATKSADLIDGVPRGGEASNTKDNLMAVYLLCHGVIAMVGVPAPEVASQYVGDVVLPEGSIAHMFAEAMYATMASLVALLALVKYTNTSILQALTVSGSIYTFVVYKHLVKDSYDEFGFRTGGGLAETAFLVFLLLNMGDLVGIVASETAALIFCGFSLLQSIISLISPTVGSMWYGLAKAPKGIFGSVFRWFHVAQFIFGATGLALLRGMSIEPAAGIASTLGALAVAEQIFGGNLGIAKTRELAMVGLALLVLISVGLFLA